MENLLLRKRRFLFETKGAFYIVDSWGEVHRKEIDWGELFPVWETNLTILDGETVVNSYGGIMTLIGVDSGKALAEKSFYMEQMHLIGNYICGISKDHFVRVRRNLKGKVETSLQNTEDKQPYASAVVGDKYIVLYVSKKKERIHYSGAERYYVIVWDSKRLKILRAIDIGVRPTYSRYLYMKTLDSSRVLIASESTQFFSLDIVSGERQDFDVQKKYTVIRGIGVGGGTVATAIDFSSEKVQIRVLRLSDMKAIEIITMSSIYSRVLYLDPNFVYVMNARRIEVWQFDISQNQKKLVLEKDLGLKNVHPRGLLPATKEELEEDMERFREQLPVMPVPKVIVDLILNFI